MNFVRPKAAHVYLVALKCCLCICATLSSHRFIKSDINSCNFGYFLASYQPCINDYYYCPDAPYLSGGPPRRATGMPHCA